MAREAYNAKAPKKSSAEAALEMATLYSTPNAHVEIPTTAGLLFLQIAEYGQNTGEPEPEPDLPPPQSQQSVWWERCGHPAAPSPAPRRTPIGTPRHFARRVCRARFATEVGMGLDCTGRP